MLTDHIESGERVAFYGPAGSGKTMLTRTLFALESPASGRVTVGGSDPTDLRPDVLRSWVAVVGETEVFEGTIADNVHLRRQASARMTCGKRSTKLACSTEF